MTEHLPYMPLTLANPRVSGYNHTACEAGSLRGRKAAAPLKRIPVVTTPATAPSPRPKGRGPIEATACGRTGSDTRAVSAAERPRPH